MITFITYLLLQLLIFFFFYSCENLKLKIKLVPYFNIDNSSSNNQKINLNENLFLSFFSLVIIDLKKTDDNFESLFIDYFLFYERYVFFLQIHLFYYFVFTLIIIFFSFFLIFISNPIYSVISLIIIYLAASFLIILFEIHFLAVIFILVYLGAVIVLFLFIVMMLNIKVQNYINFFNFLPFFFFLLIFLLFFKMPIYSFKNIYLFNVINNIEEIDIFDFFSTFGVLDYYINIFHLSNINFQVDNVLVFSFLLYTYFFIELIVCSYILLLAMIGCISLTLIKENIGLKKQDAMLQILHKNSFFKRTNLNRKLN
jgi:NADH-quinone oxidoreductase subunit J